MLLMSSYPMWGAIEKHLMNSPHDDCEVEPYALNSSMAITMVVYIEIDLMELPM